LSYIIAAGPRQRSNSRALVPRGSWQYFTVSDSRLPQTGGSGPHIYIPQEHGGLVIPPNTGLPIRRLLRFTGLRCRYSNPPSSGKWWTEINLIFKFQWLLYVPPTSTVTFPKQP
jgi:hypothetical protein